MDDVKIYYRFKAIAIDFSDINEVEKYSTLLKDYSDLKEQLALLKTSYDNEVKERADIALVAVPEISGVVEMSAFNDLRFHLFSRKVKKHCISMCITKYEDNEALGMYFKEFNNFEEVENIFKEFVNNHKLPDLKTWECKIIN